MGKAKRVRFLDDDNYDFMNRERDNSSNQVADTEPRLIDAPKTSEYAFFKKIKKDAGCSYFRSQHEMVKELRTVEFHKHQPGQQPVGGPSPPDMLKSRNPGAKFSSLVEKERDAKHYSFVSPLRDTDTKSATKRQTGRLDKIKRSNSSLLSGNVTPVDHGLFFSPTTSASANEGNQYFGKGVFVEKRRKLHQRAVDTLFPELGEGCSKGFHIVSKLLNRLFSKGCENDDTELVEAKMDATDHLSTSPSSYSLQKKLRMIHKKASMDLKNESSFDDINPTYFDGITKKNLASEREDYHAIYDTGATFLDYVADPQLIRSYQKSNSSFWFPYENLSTGSFHIQELEEYSDSPKAKKTKSRNFLLDWDYGRGKEENDVYLPARDVKKRESHNFLLDWDYGRGKEKNDEYLPARDVEDYTYSTLRTARIGHMEQFVGDMLDEIASPSLPISWICPKYDFIPYCQPNYYDTQNARTLLEYGKQEDLEARESSSRLSFTPKCLALEENVGIHNVLECGSPIVCFQDNPFCITNAFNDRPEHAVEALLLSGGLDIDMEWKCLSLSSMPGGRQLAAYYSSNFPQNGELSSPYLTERELDASLHTSSPRRTYVPFSEDAFTHHEDCSVSNILDRELECRSLIDSSCWDEPYIPKEDGYR